MQCPGGKKTQKRIGSFSVEAFGDRLVTARVPQVRMVKEGSVSGQAALNCHFYVEGCIFFRSKNSQKPGKRIGQKENVDIYSFLIISLHAMARRPLNR